ncbi:MAG: helix-turn-helix transcriptional regulator [Candidatus Omnitrophota bacterium]
MRLSKVDDHLKEELKDPHFRELYELETQKFQIVKRIIAARIRHGWTQTDLAGKAGVTQQYISKIESGEFTSIAALEKVLRFLGLTVQIRVVPAVKKASPPSFS